MHIMTVAFLLLAGPVVAEAQAPAPSPAAPAAAPAPAAPAAGAVPSPPARPPAPAELKKLEFLVGDWTHQETYHASPLGPAGRGAGRSKAMWILDDHHVYVTYKANTHMGVLEARALLGYDAAARKYRMAWFDNMGSAATYSGDFAAEGNLVLAGDFPFQGQALKEQMVFKKAPEGGFRVESRLAGADGTFAPAMEAVVTPFAAAR